MYVWNNLIFHNNTFPFPPDLIRESNATGKMTEIEHIFHEEYVFGMLNASDPESAVSEFNRLSPEERGVFEEMVSVCVCVLCVCVLCVCVCGREKNAKMEKKWKKKEQKVFILKKLGSKKWERIEDR